MSTKPEQHHAPRIARGTLPPLQPEPGESGVWVNEDQIVDERPALRMTSHPPRFTITTPGVMRRMPR